VSESLLFSNSTVKKYHKLTDRANGLTKKCPINIVIVGERLFGEWTVGSRQRIHVFEKWRP
jgi:hypothetical protein